MARSPAQKAQLAKNHARLRGGLDSSPDRPCTSAQKCRNKENVHPTTPPTPTRRSQRSPSIPLATIKHRADSSPSGVTAASGSTSLGSGLKSAGKLALAHKRVELYRHELEKGRRRERRIRKDKEALKNELRNLQGVVDALKATADELQRQVAVAEEAAATDLSESQREIRLIKKQNLLLRRQVARFPGRLALAAEHAKSKAQALTRRLESFSIKEGGVISDQARAMVRDLVSHNVPVNSINGVIGAVAKGIGVELRGGLHKRSVSQIVLEGDEASKWQYVEEADASDGVTLSGDGTSHLNLQYEARNSIFNTGDTHERRFVGIESAPNHTSEQQLVGWEDIITEFYDAYNSSPRGRHRHLDPRDFIRSLVRMMTDHAEDQKKLQRLMAAWKHRSDREVRGERAAMLLLGEELAALLWEETARVIQKVGGDEAWQGLGQSERKAWEKTIRDTVIQKLGQDEYDALPEAEKRSAGLFVSAYCCMHKELNAVKGGSKAMSAGWVRRGLPPPILLMNRDNEAAAEGGSSEAHDRAVEVSEGGGVKLASLAGALFKHKDDKKGQQDSYRIFFEALGISVRFPDTSNTRYQSHCEAAAELLVHLELYIEFLEFMRDKKTKRTFNHMEQNIYNALRDDSTLTDLCVLTLYAQAISHPYLREVRGPTAASSNHLDLGPLHDRLLLHIQSIIDNPSLLLAPDASYTTGALDGLPWERPEAFYAVLRIAPRLPHLEVMLIDFFTGAKGTWSRFLPEFIPGGVVSTLTVFEKRRAYMHTTNDVNEGELGSLRVTLRRAPRMTLHQYNARRRYKINKTGRYIEQHLTALERKYLRKKARRVDAGGLEKKRKMAQAEADRKTVEGKRKKDEEKAAKAKEKKDVLDALAPLSDTSDLSQLTVPVLDLHLDWHRQFDREVPLKTNLPRRNVKVEALAAAIQRRRDKPLASPGDLGPRTMLRERGQAEIDGEKLKSAGDSLMS
ncbi:hypothetical protein L226DRAFT_467446 [Lentinus tigrinus ALCF2SS1-7]|uniref:Uncharacterized protein n=1 Tax=Lentinus tigrinus ALCF2SS1-6 TaxID=1328759 RepID=A0A5C2S3F3_9APHY|nr:hypothetical protein L227DRAFT_505827 [Lentinus tigrinus ALCF2SS1-6]RPD72180.1 hypothetical protein L226DRAFT_467446 [Lentinus tigrinus ALCF2SS1-7]